MAAWALADDENEQLARRIYGRDPDAFARLYDAMRDDVFNLAARILGDRDTAADITQDVFLAACRLLPHESGDLHLEPWLYRVTVNRCYDHLRRERRRQTQLAAEMEEPCTPADDFKRAELAAAIEETLLKLNPRYRAALVLKDLHGLDHRETALALGISPGNARVLLLRARSAFQRAFREVSPTATGVSGIALLPALPIPASLLSPPPFLGAPSLPHAPLADPSAGMNLAEGLLPSAAASLPLLSGLGKAGVAIGTKVVLAIAGVTMMAGGGVALDRAVDDGGRPAGHQSSALAAVSIRPMRPGIGLDLHALLPVPPSGRERTSSADDPHRQADGDGEDRHAGGPDGKGQGDGSVPAGDGSGSGSRYACGMRSDRASGSKAGADGTASGHEATGATGGGSAVGASRNQHGGDTASATAQSSGTPGSGSHSQVRTTPTAGAGRIETPTTAPTPAGNASGDGGDGSGPGGGVGQFD